MQHSDVIVQEHCSYILLECAKNQEICAFMFNYGIAVDVFTVLKQTMDVDVQKNSLHLLHLLLDLPDIETFLLNIDQYSMKLLLCYLKNEFTEIQEITMKILIKLSELGFVCVKEKMIEDGIITSMFAFIMVRVSFCKYTGCLR